MENKLRSLLKRMEEDSSVEKCSDDSFVSLDESMSQNLRANYGGVTAPSNTACGSNGTCSGNGTCIGNNICANNGTCK